MQAILGASWRLGTIIHAGRTIEEMAPDMLEALRTPRAASAMQVGINECAPRPLGPNGRARLANLKPVWLRGRIISALHRWRPRIIRFRPLAQRTTLDRFAESLTRIVR